MRKLVFVAPAFFLLAGCGPEPAPSLLLVTLDTVRADRLGSYGSSLGLTPGLDALASESIRFADVTCQTPLTTPSHATILTGLLPQKHGVRNNESFRLGESTATLASVLRDAGYRTAAFIGASPLESRYGLDRGFDVYDESFEKDSPSPERSAVAVLKAAEPFVRESLAGGKPFFVWLHLFDAHTPYEAPEPFRSRFPGDAYGAEIAYLDDALRKFLDSFREAGLLDRAVVSVLADHGEGLGEHGESTHGALLYESTLRVPWLLRLPRGRFGGRIVEEPVRTLDVAPTLLGLSRAPALAGADGMDLSPFLEGGTVPELAVHSESLYLRLLLGWSELRSLRRGPHKAIEGSRRELFDLARDPDETENLWEKLRTQAEALLSEIRSTDLEVAEADLSNETADRLAALGYATGSTPAGILRRDPRDGMAIWREIESGTSLVSRDPASARVHFERALALDPGNGLVLKSLGDVALSEGRIDQALACYRASAKTGFAHRDLDVGLARAHLLKGRSLRARGEAARAESELRRGLVATPADGALLNELGSVLAEQGRRSDARQAFEKAIAASPEAGEPRRNLAVLLEGPESERLLREAIRLDPDYAAARIDLARRLAMDERLAEAAQEIDLALRLRPNDPEAIFLAARIAELEGRAETAISRYERFLTVAPEALAGPRETARRRLSVLRAER